MTDKPTRELPRFSQETIAIVASAIVLLGTIVFEASRLESRIGSLEAHINDVQSELRAEAQADREALQAAARADRAALEAAARADREALEAAARADRDMFTREILRLTKEQSQRTTPVDPDRP